MANRKSPATVEFDDLAMMRDESRWPGWPYLPVKKRGTVGGPDLADKTLGLLWIGTKGLTVHHAYLWNLPPTVEEFRKCLKTTYPTQEAMVADGWVVD